LILPGSIEASKGPEHGRARRTRRRPEADP